MTVASPISTHVLDISTGQPAGGLGFELARQTAGGQWEALAQGVTDAQGRSAGLQLSGPVTVGVYRLSFATGDYFERRGVMTFYPAVTVEFQVAVPGERYHVPLILGPFGYSTYRGS